jgi:Family of unknown function (DUF5670)
VQKRTDAGGRFLLPSPAEKEFIVLTTLLVVLILLWLLGMGTSYTLGGLIHVLLVIAIIVILVRVIQGRNPLQG